MTFTKAQKLLFLAAVALIVLVAAFVFFPRKVDLDRIPSHDSKDKLTLITFWSITCSTCISELPLIKTTWDDFHSKSLRVVGVSVAYDNLSAFKAFVASRQMLFPYTVVHETKEVSGQFGAISATPTTFLIDAKGNIVRTYLGALDKSVLYRDIKRYL